MIKYEYTFKNNIVKRSSIKKYFSINYFIERTELGDTPENLKNILENYLEGEAEVPLLSIENQWFSIQEEIQNIDEKVKNLQAETDNLGNKLSEDLIINNKNIIDSLIGKVDQLGYISESEKSALISRRKIIEEDNKWLKAYRGEETEEIRPEVIIKEPEEKYLKKIIEVERNQKVRSVEDSIADLAKMNSLLFSCISAMYGTMTDSAKSKIDAGTKELIDYSVEKFSNTQTRADRQLVKEGTSLVDKLFEREVQIADIIDEVKGE